MQVLLILAQLEFPGLLSDSLWHLPIYTGHPDAGPGFLFYRYPFELEGITLRFASDPTLFHSAPFSVSARGLSLRPVEDEKPITKAYSEQAGGWGLSRFGALFSRKLGQSGDIMGTFDYNEFGLLTQQTVGHQGLVSASGTVKGLRVGALVLSASRDSASYLHARAGAGFGPIELLGWRSNASPYGSGGLSVHLRLARFGLAVLREELSWKGNFLGIWEPKVVWGSGMLRAWAGWFSADSGAGPVLGARVSGPLGLVEAGYRTDIPDPAFIPGTERTVSEAYIYGESKGFGLAGRADLGYGDWVYGYKGDSGGIVGIGKGLRASGALAGNWELGVLLVRARGQASWFSNPAPEQVYINGFGLVGLKLSALRGDMILIPSIGCRYYGEPFSYLWPEARIDATFYKAVRAYAAVENLTDETLNFFGYRWPTRAWRFGASLILWD
ncbi:MAG: hypothetical protein ABIM74_05790 [candidate division WOR-3 bacterium]